MHLLDEEEQTADGAVVRVDEELGEGGDLLPKAGALKQSVGQGGWGVQTNTITGHSLAPSLPPVIGLGGQSYPEIYRQP